MQAQHRVSSEGPVVRNRTFDALRIVFALMVLYAHAFELIGQGDREIFSILHLPLSWGSVGVDGFFLLSGYLIVQSWIRTPRWSVYLRKRILRIVPGYIVAVAFSVIVVGLLAPGTPHFFWHLLRDKKFFASVAALSGPMTPPVFPGLLVPGVNNSLWTITYEFRCYLIVGIVGSFALIRKRIGWLTLTLALFILGTLPSVIERLAWEPHLIQGDIHAFARLLPAFFLGGCFALYKDRIVFRPVFAIAAICGLTLAVLLHAQEVWFILFGGYLLFFLASLKLSLLQSARDMPDISYGLYLYAWPVESLVIYFVHTPPLVTFFITSLVSALLGWLSWHFVERPMLTLKVGRRVELPHA